MSLFIISEKGFLELKKKVKLALFLLLVWISFALLYTNEIWK